MQKRMYELRTKGERGNRANPLEPLLNAGNKTDFLVIRYFDNDSKVEIVAFGDIEEDFKAYSSGTRLLDNAIPKDMVRRTADKSGKIIDSLDADEIGKYEDTKTGKITSIKSTIE